MKELSKNVLIRLEKITKKRKQQIVLDEVSLSIHQGECYGIFGENGSGKTTLLQIITKILKPSSGSIQYPSPIEIGFVPQEDGFFEEVTALDNLKLWTKDSQRLQSSPYIQRLGLSDFLHKPVNQLSGGMKRRLSLVCGLINDPSVIVLDEPFSSLDIIYQQELIEFIEELLENDKTIILSAHDQVGFDLASQRYWLHHGKLEPLDSGLKYQQLYRWIKQGENHGR